MGTLFSRWTWPCSMVCTIWRVPPGPFAGCPPRASHSAPRGIPPIVKIPGPSSHPDSRTGRCQRRRSAVCPPPRSGGRHESDPAKARSDRQARSAPMARASIRRALRVAGGTGHNDRLPTHGILQHKGCLQRIFVQRIDDAGYAFPDQGLVIRESLCHSFRIGHGFDAHHNSLHAPKGSSGVQALAPFIGRRTLPRQWRLWPPPPSPPAGV